MEHPKCPDCQIPMGVLGTGKSIDLFGIPIVQNDDEGDLITSEDVYGVMMYVCTECGLIRLYSARHRGILHPEYYRKVF